MQQCVIPRTLVTWNNSDRDVAVVTLSGGNLVATLQGTSGDNIGSVRATTSKSSGKWFWETTVGTEQAGDLLVVGTADSVMNIGILLGSTSNSWGYQSDGKKVNNSAPVAYGATWTSGDVIGIALDMGAGTIEFYKNGASQGVAYSTLTGSQFPALSLGSVTLLANTTTTNFGATAYTFTAPTGYGPL